DRIAPDVALFGPFHSPDLLHNALALAFRERRIPICCLPASAYVGERNSILGRFNNLKLGMLSTIIAVEYDWLNRVLTLFFLTWLRTYKNSTLFISVTTLMLAARFVGFLPSNHWQKPSEFFDRVYVYSDFSARMLADTGYDRSKIFISGIPLLDRVR